MPIRPGLPPALCCLFRKLSGHEGHEKDPAMRDILDEKDRLLVNALRRNARASLVSLARDIGLSRSATHDRVLKLEERGVIRRYTVDVDRRALPNTRAFFSVQFASEVAQRALADKIHALEGVEAAYCLSGDIDMLAYCECDSDHDLAELRDRVAQFEGVTSIRTRHVLATSMS